MKKCLKCAGEMPDDQFVCSNCGAELEENSEVMGAESAAEQTEETAVTEQAVETAVTEQIEETAVAEPVMEKAEEAAVVTPAAESGGNPPGKTKKIGVIVGAIAAVAVIGVSAAVVGKKLSAKDPKQVVIDAFKSVYTQETKTPIEEIFGFEDIIKYSQVENSEGSMSLKLENCYLPEVNTYAGSGIDMTAKSDVKNKKYLINYGIQYQNLELAQVNLYMDKTHIMASVPELSKKVFSLNYGEDLAGQIEASPYIGKLASENGMDLTAVADYMNYMMSFYGEDSQGLPFDLVALWDRYKTGSQAIEDLKTAMTVEKIKKAAYIVDGNSQDCQGYQATITKDAAINFLRTTSEFFLQDETLKKDVAEYLTQVINYSEGLTGESIYGIDSAEGAQTEVWREAEKGMDQFLTALDKYMGDLNITVYVDKKGRMSAMDANTTLTNDTDEVIDVKLEMKLEGGSYLQQNANYHLTLTNNGSGELMSADLMKTGSYDQKTLTSGIQFTVKTVDDTINFGYAGTYQSEDKSYQMDFTFDNEIDNGTVNIAGVVTELEKGKAVYAEADSIKVVYNDTELVELSGSYGFKPLEGEVAALEGDVMDILAASEKDWETVQMEIMMSAFSLMGQLK